MNVRLDKKDKDLLTLLYLDSRESFTRMGKKLNLSSSAVERRLKKLKGGGIVSLMFADVNLAKLGFKGYRLYFKFDVMDEETEKEVLELFGEYSRTLWGVICEGEYDVLWRIIAKDELEVEKAINLVTERFGGKIIEKTVVATTYQAYLSWNRAFGGKRQPELPLEKITKVEELDGDDMGILAMLYGNARATTVEIANEVGLSADAVQYRLKRLKAEGYVLGNTCWYDAGKLGLEYYKILIGFRNITPEDEKKFLGFCKEQDNIIFVNKTIGSWDVEVDVVVENVVELHGFIRDLKTRFGQIMGKHTYVAAIEERMLNPLREYLR